MSERSREFWGGGGGGGGEEIHLCPPATVHFLRGKEFATYQSTRGTPRADGSTDLSTQQEDLQSRLVFP